MYISFTTHISDNMSDSLIQALELPNPGDIIPVLGSLTKDDWILLMYDLRFWVFVALRNVTFPACKNCTLDQDAFGPFITANDNVSAILVRPSVDGTGIMICIIQVIDGYICGAVFIVDSTNELSVININDTALPERIVIATAFDNTVLFSDIVHPTVTHIYKTHCEMFETLLLQTQ
jgi:hypothetical protein